MEPPWGPALLLPTPPREVVLTNRMAGVNPCESPPPEGTGTYGATKKKRQQAIKEKHSKTTNTWLFFTSALQKEQNRASFCTRAGRGGDDVGRVGRDPTGKFTGSGRGGAGEWGGPFFFSPSLSWSLMLGLLVVCVCVCAGWEGRDVCWECGRSGGPAGGGANPPRCVCVLRLLSVNKEGGEGRVPQATDSVNARGIVPSVECLCVFCVLCLCARRVCRVRVCARQDSVRDEEVRTNSHEVLRVPPVDRSDQTRRAVGRLEGQRASSSVYLPSPTPTILPSSPCRLFAVRCSASWPSGKGSGRGGGCPGSLLNRKPTPGST